MSVFDDEYGGGGGFGDEAFVVDEEGVVGAGFGGGVFGEDVAEEVEGFDIAAFPAPVGVGDGGGGEWFFVVALGDGEEEVGRPVVVVVVVALGRASGDVEVDEWFGELCLLEGVVEMLFDLGEVDAVGHIHFFEAVFEALEVLLVSEEFVVVSGDDFVDAVAEIEASVEECGRRLVEGQDLIVDNGEFHGRAPMI